MSEESPKCPKCRSVVLRDAQPALTCPKCEGMWLSQTEAERLVQTDFIEDETGTDSSQPTGESLDGKVGMCPFEHSILTRAKVDVDDAFYLDRCHACGGIWFDQGEWARLASAQLLGLLGDLWNPVWRRQLRQAKERANRVADLKESIGAELFAKLDAVANELREHDHRSQALAYLHERVTSLQQVEEDTGGS